MKYIFTIVLFISAQVIIMAQSNNKSKSDREIEIMEKMENRIDEKEKSEIEAQKQIFSFKNETNEAIRLNRSKITNEEFKNLNELQIMLWKRITDKQKYYNSSKKFLANEYHLLNNYREDILNRLNQYINNDDRITYQIDETQKKGKEEYELEICLAEYQKLLKQSEEIKKQNEILLKQVDFLKNKNIELKNSLDNLTTLITKGSENLEKSLKSLKEKDSKILILQDTLIKKDILIEEIIKNKDVQIQQLQKIVAEKEIIIKELSKK